VPFEYRFDASLNCLFTRWIPPLSALDVSVFGESVLSRPEMDERTARLNDLRALTGEMLTADVRALAEGMARWDRRTPPHRAAHIVGTELVFGLTRIFQTVRGAGGEKMAVFRNVDDALRWLALPEELGDPFAADRWQPEGEEP